MASMLNQVDRLAERINTKASEVMESMMDAPQTENSMAPDEPPYTGLPGLDNLRYPTVVNIIQKVEALEVIGQMIGGLGAPVGTWETANKYAIYDNSNKNPKALYVLAENSDTGCRQS